jgi:hypothetical protein
VISACARLLIILAIIAKNGGFARKNGWKTIAAAGNKEFKYFDWRYL